MLDNGGKFVSKAFSHFLKDHGIAKHMPTPYMPQLNGVIKRENFSINK